MMTRGERIPVGILGATGSVGQRMVRLLEEHPWFRIAYVTASERSAGRDYAAAVRWVQDGPVPPEVAGLEVRPTDPDAVGSAEAPLVLSALDASVAGEAESAFARAGALVVSNARSHRMDPTVPLLIPEVNPDHLALLERQEAFSGGGGIITNPNCAAIGLALALKPLHDAFGIREVQVVTLQAVSGAGLPGVASMEIMDNVIPFIPGEEEKLEREPLKILGTLTAEGVESASFRISAQCNRVPVVDGHLECVSVGLERTPEPDEAVQVMGRFRGRAQGLGLPSAPRLPIHVMTGAGDPQPRLHRGLERGMALAVGRIRPCPVLGLRFVVLSHNTVRGAAGGGLLAAELALAEGRVPGVRLPR